MLKKTKKIKIPYKLVYIEWEDSRLPTSKWSWLSDYEDIETVTCVSIGYLIKETKTAIALASDFGDITQEEMQVTGISQIPKSAIRFKRILE